MLNLPRPGDVLGLYAAGILRARWASPSIGYAGCSGVGRSEPFLMEMPAYKIPDPANVLVEAWFWAARDMP